jgi:hypothetical protein
MSENITYALQVAGVDLFFSPFVESVKGILGFETSLLNSMGTTEYAIERQNYIVMLATQTVFDKALFTGQEFNYTTGMFKYNFKIDGLIDNLDGWSKATAILLSRELS